MGPPAWAGGAVAASSGSAARARRSFLGCRIDRSPARPGATCPQVGAVSQLLSVVPAKAGTHSLRASKATCACDPTGDTGYGSLLSQGRQYSAFCCVSTIARSVRPSYYLGSVYRRAVGIAGQGVASQ